MQRGEYRYVETTIFVLQSQPTYLGNDLDIVLKEVAIVYIARSRRASFLTSPSEGYHYGMQTYFLIAIYGYPSSSSVPKDEINRHFRVSSMIWIRIAPLYPRTTSLNPPRTWTVPIKGLPKIICNVI